MSVRLFIKDNVTGEVHEYGENCHDSLILQPNGSLHYENMQICAGTAFPEEGYTFVLKDGTDPRTAEDYIEYGVDAYIDIGGERKGANCLTCKSRDNEELCDACIYNQAYGSCYERATDKDIFNRLFPEESEE